MVAIAEKIGAILQIGTKVRRPDFIYPVTHGDYKRRHDLIDLPYKVRHAFWHYVITTFDSSFGTKEAFKEYVLPGETLSHRVCREALTPLRSGLWDAAERANNGLRKRLINSPSPLGKIADTMYNDFSLFHHNHPHSRRLEDMLELIVLNSPDIYLSKEAIEGLAGFPYSHDIEQVSGYLWSGDCGKILPVKEGHDWAGAVLRLAQFKEYARERHISLNEAWRFSAWTALLIFPHASPENLKKLLEAKGNAAEQIYQGDDPNGEVNGQLWEDVMANNIDITTLSVYQMVKLVQKKRKESGFFEAEFNGQKTRYGLFPPMEERYKDELADFLSQDEYKKPLFPKMSNADKRAFKNSLLLAAKVDVQDMSAPLSESLPRKVNVSKSIKRNFYDVTGEDSDVARGLFEIEHVADLITGTPLEKSLVIRNIVWKNALMSVLLFEELGERLMRGDLGVISEIYERRLFNLGRKILRKISSDFSLDTDIASAVNKIQQILDASSNEEAAKRFRESVIVLRKEEQETMINFMKKPNNANGVHIYTENEITSFRQRCNAVMDKLSRQFPFSDQDLLHLVVTMKAGESVPCIGFTSYDSSSLNGLTMKTLVEHGR